MKESDETSQDFLASQILPGKLFQTETAEFLKPRDAKQFKHYNYKFDNDPKVRMGLLSCRS